MATLCFLKDYNKYFNRTIKPVRQLSDVYNYKQAIFNSINFVENDLVNTTQIINWNYDWIPDYMVIIDNSYGYDPNYMMEHLELCKVSTPDPQGITVNVDSAEGLQELGLMTESGAVNLFNLANYHNDSYSLNYIDFEGNWSLDNFSLYFTDPRGQSFNTLVIAGDQSTVTLQESDLPDNGIISKAFLISKGWYPTDNTVSWFKFTASSPDAFNGQLIFSDYTHQCPIKQSWFVLEGDETRKGQFNFTLRRDLVSDDIDAVRTSVSNIERCELTADNPLIYNHEPFTFNQIKQKEVYLYDRTACPWIVGYLPAHKSDGSAPDPIGETFALSKNYDISMSTINHDEWDYYRYTSTTARCRPYVESVKFPMIYETGFLWTDHEYGTAIQDRYGNNSYNTAGWWDVFFYLIKYSKDNYYKIKDGNRSSWVQWSVLDTKLYTTYPDNFLTDAITNDLQFYNGKKILFQDGVYRIEFKPYSNVTSEISGGDNDLTNTFLNYMQAHYAGDIARFKDRLKMTIKYTRYSLSMKKVASADSLTYIIPSGTNKLVDAPYRMFCMPYPININVTFERGQHPTFVSTDINLAVVQNIIENTITGSSDGTDTLYDIQILPYCPFEFENYTYITPVTPTGEPDGSFNEITIPSSFVDGVDYTNITHTDSGGHTSTVGKIFFPKESTFRFTINETFINGVGHNHQLSAEFPITDLKIQNETEFVRLCSPNYASAYDFSPAKNNGLNAINVMCTYKPYNPYILLTPEYSGLYGRTFSDARGLILEGDFSLPIINSHWTQYELNNKTYQQSFNREIQNMDVEFNIQRQEQLFNAIGGTVKGGAAGAAAGAMVGGGYGAIAGAVIGTATSAIGGALDYVNMMKRQNEAINYRFDMYNYALQNIKALPTTLTKTSSINANNKYVPFIEGYYATEREVAILRDFIKYNGMTAGYTGQINMSGYVQGNIIRYTGSLGEYELSELNKELMKGVYL